MAKSKRSRGLSGGHAKQLRLDMGLTQKELGKLIGRNASNISRFERNITQSKDLENAYRRAERLFYNKMNIMSQLKSLEEGVRESIQELIDYQKKSGESHLSPAGEYFINNIGFDVFNFDINGKDWLNLDINELRHNLAEVEKFADSATSDVEGYLDYKKRLLKNSQSISGLKGKGRNELYWDVYNRLKNDMKAEMLERLGLSGGEKYSEQLELEISVILNEIGTDHTVDEIVDRFLADDVNVSIQNRNKIIQSFVRRKKNRHKNK